METLMSGKLIAITAIVTMALTGCVVSQPSPTDTAAPPVSPVMSCDDAQAFVDTALSADPDTMTGVEARRRVLGADSVILANSSCFSVAMVTNALGSFKHESLDPQKYGYSD